MRHTNHKVTGRGYGLAFAGAAFFARAFSVNQ